VSGRCPECGWDWDLGHPSVISPKIPLTSATFPALSSPEQAELRETSINEIGLALARIEQQQNGVIGLMNHRLAAAEESLAGLSAKLDTLSGQLPTNIEVLDGAQGLNTQAVLRRIDKLGNDMFAALAVLKLRKNKHKRKKGKK